MSKQPFPYASAATAMRFPQDGPLGVLAARILEAHGILPGIQSLWRQMTGAAELAPPTVLELLGPFASLAVTDMVVSFETFLRSLDASLRPCTISYFHSWPTPRRSNRPYGFFFYDLDKVRRHFQRVFSIDVFHRTPFPLLRDWVLLRHLFAHANGFPGYRDAGCFRHYRIQPARRLLIAADQLDNAAGTIQTTATRINNRIAMVATRAFVRAEPTLSWARVRGGFLRLMRPLTFLGTLERNEEHYRLLFRTLVAIHAPRRELETRLDPIPRPIAVPWSS